jgi:hypothetical protein
VTRLPSLPPPTSFSEGQRLAYGCLVAAAGMFCGAMSIALICLLMWGNWSKAEEHSIVVIFGWTLLGFVACMSTVIVGLLVGGPVGRFKGGVSKDGVNWEADSGNAPAASVTATATVTAPPPGGAS